MRRHEPTLARLIERFLVEHLPVERGASMRTVESYATTLRLFVNYCVGERRMKIGALCLEDWSAATILEFLMLANMKKRGNLDRPPRVARRLGSVKGKTRYARACGALDCPETSSGWAVMPSRPRPRWRSWRRVGWRPELRGFW